MTDDTHVQPQWQPPSHLTDPLIRRYVFPTNDARGRAYWSRLSRCRIPGVREQAVAWRLADYANKDGHNCHPGMARLARDTCSSEKTVRRAMAWLTENGWCTIQKRGRRKLAEADVYYLSLPAPVAIEAGLWDFDANGTQWMNRPKDEPKRPELRQEKPSFPAVNSDRYADVLEVTPDFLEVTDDGLEVNVDLPPGPTHPDLSTPLRDSITASRACARRADEDVDADEVIGQIEAQIGGPMSYDVSAMVDGMLCRDADPRMIVRVAVARERNPA